MLIGCPSGTVPLVPAMSDVLTGQTRYRVGAFRKLILQVEVVTTHVDVDPYTANSRAFSHTRWRDAKLQDITDKGFWDETKRLETKVETAMAIARTNYPAGYAAGVNAAVYAYEQATGDAADDRTVDRMMALISAGKNER